MPELPEVETTRRGLAPHLVGRTIDAVVLRRPDLRWPIPPEVAERLPGYFEQELAAYGRGGEPCPRCGRALRQASIGQRATVWCGHCQR